jgi:hypothetical protein
MFSVSDLQTRQEIETWILINLSLARGKTWIGRTFLGLVEQNEERPNFLRV